ncbi:MAG: pyruvoyl-dependent arginine decarboxylase [Haloarculaceae archaeon]
MDTIRIVWGTAEGPTPTASYDAALAEAGVHNYNLVPVSSVIPAGARVDPVGTAPDLGPTGERLTVVEGRTTVAGPDRATAGVGWTTTAGEGPGVFYEAGGEADEETIRSYLREGLAAARELRDWEFVDEDLRTVTTEVDSGTYATAVVLAVYGDSTPIL